MIDPLIEAMHEPFSSESTPLQTSSFSLLATEFSDDALEQLLEAVEKQVNRDYRRFYGKVQ